MRTCIYCLVEKPDDAFNREHVLPQGFGVFDDNFVLHVVCKDCNGTMGREIETQGIRGSIEGIHRYHTPELSDPAAFAKTPSKRVTFERQEPEWEGVRIFVRLSDDGKAVDEVLPPQVRITYKNGSRANYLLTELPESLDPATISHYRAYGTTAEDLAAVVSAVTKRGLAPKWQDPVEELPTENRINVTARAVYDDLSRRLVAKIVFNYLAHQSGAAFALRSEFNPIRRFIRYGEGRGPTFVEPTRTPFLREEQETPGFRGTDAHLVAITHSQDGGLVGHVSLFNMIHNEIKLSRGRPGAIVLPSVGSSFSWKMRTISPMLHIPAHNLVQPPSVLVEWMRRKR